MLTWNEFAWGVFYLGVLSKDVTGNSDYLQLMRQTQLLQKLRTNPSSLQVDEIQEKVMKGFLNRWRCRIENTPTTANAIKTALKNLAPYLKALQGLQIVTVQFNSSVNVGGNRMTISQVIEYCYKEVRQIGHRFGATATSKLLHIIQPELFVMWDYLILDHYHKSNHQVSDSEQGYCAFLQMMQQLTMQVRQSFLNANLNPPAVANQSPAQYLSAQMHYNPPKTMAKYLDEYNWIIITHGVQVPPTWHP